MTIYIAAIDHPGDVTTYVLGITESQARDAFSSGFLQCLCMLKGSV